MCKVRRGRFGTSGLDSVAIETSSIFLKMENLKLLVFVEDILVSIKNQVSPCYHASNSQDLLTVFDGKVQQLFSTITLAHSTKRINIQYKPTYMQNLNEEIKIAVMYQSNRSLNIPPGHTPGI